MSKLTFVFLSVFLALISACSVDEEIYGDGDILSASGLYDCALEEAPCSSVHNDGEDYSRELTAKARENWLFHEWTGCTETIENRCILNGEVNTTQLGKSWTLRALFRPKPEFTLIAEVEYDGEPKNEGAVFYNDPLMSADGNFVVFRSHYQYRDENNTLRHETSRCHLYSRETSQVVEISTDSKSGCYPIEINADGSSVLLAIKNENGPQADDFYNKRIYIYERESATVSPFMHEFDFPLDALSIFYGNYYFAGLGFSENYRYVAFTSADSSLVANDDNTDTDIFIYDREQQDIELINGPSFVGDIAPFPSRVNFNDRGQLVVTYIQHLSADEDDYSVFTHCSGQVKLATDLEFFQYNCSAMFGANLSLC